MTVSRRSPERRSVGPLLSTVRLGEPRADVLTSRIAVYGYERSARQGGRLPLETVGKDFLARVLAAPSHQSQVIEEYIDDLTQGSLQSPSELDRVAAALGMPQQALGTDRKVLKTIFGIRNEIIHELDINLDAERRRRNLRRSSDMIAYTDALLKVAENMRDAVEKKLALATPPPSAEPAPAAGAKP